MLLKVCIAAFGATFLAGASASWVAYHNGLAHGQAECRAAQAAAVAAGHDDFFKSPLQPERGNRRF